MNIVRTRQIRSDRSADRQLRPGIGCQRCQERNEYLMVFDLPEERCVWVCPACHYELTRAHKLKA